MGCQKGIAQTICDKKVDYILALKGNQGALHQDVRLLFQDEELLQNLKTDDYQTVDGSEHGRIETRTYRVVEIPKALQENHNWQDLQTIIEINSKREIKGITTKEKRYYISSLPKML